jgi:2-oxopent-4-enoate/cis-2-oxohex-4-enoate hydratase
MRFVEGEDVPIGARLIQPRAEAEVAFVLGRALRGPGITAGDVLAATEHVLPCFEIVDSRIEAWKIRYQDTVADNASSGLFLIGAPASPRGIDFAAIEVTVEKNGAPLSRGTGAEALGSPLACVAWLANQLGELGHALEAGELVLSGSLVPLEPVRPGDVMRMDIPGLGGATVRFS